MDHGSRSAGYRGHEHQLNEPKWDYDLARHGCDTHTLYYQLTTRELLENDASRKDSAIGVTAIVAARSGDLS